MKLKREKKVILSVRASVFGPSYKKKNRTAIKRIVGTYTKKLLLFSTETCVLYIYITDDCELLVIIIHVY